MICSKSRSLANCQPQFIIRVEGSLDVTEWRSVGVTGRTIRKARHSFHCGRVHNWTCSHLVPLSRFVNVVLPASVVRACKFGRKQPQPVVPAHNSPRFGYGPRPYRLAQPSLPLIHACFALELWNKTTKSFLTMCTRDASQNHRQKC